MTPSLFVTGTDTEIGKTHVAAALIRALRASGLRVAPFKPVSAGCERTPEGLRNEDALALIEAAGGGFHYDDVNPVALADPVAPHLAAADSGLVIDPAVLDAAHARLAASADLVVVEGAGGWRVPLTPTLDTADWVAGHGWPVLLVVGMRLGCLNHALLSAEAIARRTWLAGWVANVLPPVQPRWRDNVASLQARLPETAARVVIEPGANPEAAVQPLVDIWRNSGTLS
ncbi:dethiobiotin synthase [Spectribacter hydrogenoxidans]|uniref:ATP-dependent dethiobiotin synthetase BioD n=1 Tax=Spectribacter hydrogenoxidans TaxID=3075608 RepID=A0ABU3BY46_9GAMM|nr:dethiobiotin synthase [Salinisphaera sp. W335]MDT0634229.1 dethiobiotin synthase [Salinisphaera sp. W335]